MKWEKTSPGMIKLFDTLLPDDPRVERRKMFGYHCAFANGNMFCGMHGNKVVVRLPEEKRVELIRKGWEQFAPMPGRVMREYLVFPEPVLRSKGAKTLLAESLEYAFALPPKKKK